MSQHHRAEHRRSDGMAKPMRSAMKRGGMAMPEKVHTVMSEFKRGTLHSGSGGIVKNRKQAVAIALSEARRGKH